jgi:hypothetical protein
VSPDITGYTKGFVNRREKEVEMWEG